MGGVEPHLEQFVAWKADVWDDAVCLSTATPDGVPSARMVLCKGADDRGFVFHTNGNSAKGRDLDANPVAALTWYWPPDKQVRVTGAVERLAVGESDDYWASRPRASQLGAWASPQSEVIAGRGELEARLAEVTARFDGVAVARPPHWGGYRVVPETIEYWIHRDDRLHDRVRWRRTSGGWVSEVLAP